MDKKSKTNKRRICDNSKLKPKRIAFKMEQKSSTILLASCNPLTSTNDSLLSLGSKESTSSFESVYGLEEEEVSPSPTFPIEEYDVISLKLDSQPATMSTENSEIVSNWLEIFEKIPKSIQQDALGQLVNLCSHSHVLFLKTVIEPRFQKDFIKGLPKEILLKIFEHLCPQDLVKVSQISPLWRCLAEDGFLWTRKCQEYGIRDIYTDFRFRHKNWISRIAQALGDISPVLVPDFTRSYDSISSEMPKTLEVCLKRSKWKALYLRSRWIQSNWRKGQPIASCTLKGHEEHVITCLQVKGDLIVTGSDDNTIGIWSSASGELTKICHGHTGGVWSLLLSEDGKLVISGSTDRTVRVWGVEDGILKATLTGHTSTVRCMALKNNKLVSGSRDCTIRVWELSTIQLSHNSTSIDSFRTLYGHVAAVRCVQFDGRRVISGGYDCNIIVWNVDNGEIIHVLRGHSSRFESGRDLVISGSLDTTIRIWNIKEGTCLQTLIGHQSLTSGMQLNGNILVSANADSTIKVWNINDSVCLHTLAGPYRHQSAVTSLQFVGDTIVATSSDDGTVKLWDVEQGIYICDLLRLNSHRTGGCVWRIEATPTMLVCAAGSRNGTEDTKIIILDFNAPYP